MTENAGTVDLPEENCEAQAICKKVYTVANVLQVQVTDPSLYCFAAKTTSAAVDTLISLSVTEAKAKITINCEKMVIGSMLLKDLKQALSQI